MESVELMEREHNPNVIKRSLSKLSCNEVNSKSINNSNDETQRLKHKKYREALSLEPS